jgi:hypothetical protein
VGDIEMGVVLCLLGAVLPDVWTQHFPGSRVDDVGAGVEGAQGVSPCNVNLAVYGQTNGSLWVHGLVEVVKEALADLFDVIDGVGLVSDNQSAEIVHLPSGSGVEAAAIEDDDVGAFVLLLNVGEDSEHFGVELDQSVVLVVEVVGLWDVDGFVEDELGGFGNLFGTEGDFCV